MFQHLRILQRGYGQCLLVKILGFIRDIIKPPCVVLFTMVQKPLPADAGGMVGCDVGLRVQVSRHVRLQVARWLLVGS